MKKMLKTLAIFLCLSCCITSVAFAQDVTDVRPYSEVTTASSGLVCDVSEFVTTYDAGSFTVPTGGNFSVILTVRAIGNSNPVTFELHNVDNDQIYASAETIGPDETRVWRVYLPAGKYAYTIIGFPNSAFVYTLIA